MRRVAVSLVLALTFVASGLAPASAQRAKRETAAAPSGRASEVVGRYAALRGGKDTGCMVTLDPGRAQLAPACRDHGLVIFDPKGWSLSGNKLMLRARKGHSAAFVQDAEGVWQKEGKEGQPLGLRKM